MIITKLAIGMAFAIALATTPSWAAGSKCDASISKAAGKKVSCRCNVYAKAQLKGTTPDATKLAKCGTKFLNTCNKAQAKGGCSVQNGSCTAKESQADSFSTALCTSSATPAFVD